MCGKFEQLADNYEYLSAETEINKYQEDIQANKQAVLWILINYM